MAVCKICGQEIPRGHRYRGERYKNISVCSENCYLDLVKQKEKETLGTPLRRLKDYIDELYDGNINWIWMQKQIKSMSDDYNLDYRQIHMTIRYAVIYEDYVVDTSFGLYQFVKFIEPAQKFADDIQKNKDLAEDLPEEIIMVRKPCKQKRLVKEEDWD